MFFFWRALVFCPILGNETSPESFLLHNALARKPKRIRTAFSPSQLLRLEHAFEKNHYVVGAERKQLAHSLSLTETQVRHPSHVLGIVLHLSFTSTYFTCTVRSFRNVRACLLLLGCMCLSPVKVHGSARSYFLNLIFVSCDKKNNIYICFFLVCFFKLTAIIFCSKLANGSRVKSIK